MHTSFGGAWFGEPLEDAMHLRGQPQWLRETYATLRLILANRILISRDIVLHVDAH